MMNGQLRWLMLVVIFGTFSANSARAVTISPVMVELTPAHRVVAVTVSNESDLPVILQTETLAWTQLNGEDRHEKNDDLLVAPPIAEIKPGGSQIFRVTLRRPASAVAERAYRLVLDDVSAIKKVTKGIGVTFSFSHRLPVFVAGTGKIGPKPHLGACPAPASSGCVRLDNEGDRFYQVKRLNVKGNDWHKELNAGTRVLAGAWKQWTFAWPANHNELLTVNAETSAGPVSLELPAPSQ
jgi:fimbrial chaperone protein